MEVLTASSDERIGHFLSLNKLIAEYDPVLRNHLARAQAHNGAVSYLSTAIQNEFTGIIAENVRSELLRSIKRNKYYGVMFDTTPDASHREQMSQIIRYVDVDFVTKNVEVRESFLGFIKVYSKDAKSIVDLITHTLERNMLPLADCRSQCYDNAAVMSGHLSGVHKRIVDRNPWAIFVNCDNHSLNLVGIHSASQELETMMFFRAVESLYNFFAKSMQRWKKMKDVLTCTVKQECDTRWSAKFDAVKAVHFGLAELVDLLETMSADANETSKTREDAQGLLQNIVKFKFIVLLAFWYDLLSKINRVQNKLQDPAMNFHEASKDLRTLKQVFGQNRDSLCKNALVSGKEKCRMWGMQIQGRVRKRKKMDGEQLRDEVLTADMELTRAMKSVVDRLLIEMDNRFTRLNELDAKFGFLIDVKRLLDNKSMSGCSLEECCALARFYSSDFDGTELYNEICDCRMLVQTRKSDARQTALELLKFVVSYMAMMFFQVYVLHYKFF